MGKDTSIQWTDHTWPVTTGCDDASPGCLNCYSKPASYRMGLNPNPKIAGAYAGTVEKRAGVLRWTGMLRTLPDRLDWPMKWRKPARVFVGNMSDLFHPEVPFDFVDRVFATMALTPHHTYQVLTKRAERMAEYILTPGRNGCWGQPALEMAKSMGWVADASDPRWLAVRERIINPPLPNVHLGVSVENRKHGLPRVDHLRGTPAALRFLSVEPLLEDLGNVGVWGVGWGIVGGGSGADARSFDIAWARSLRDQCKAAGVPCFMKQIGSAPREREPSNWPNGYPGGDGSVNLMGDGFGNYDVTGLKDGHGGDWDEWPEDLRVREFPTPSRLEAS